jgi:hypothetical protein
MNTNFYLLIIGILIIALALKVNCKSKFTPVNIPDIPVSQSAPQPYTENVFNYDINSFQPYIMDSRYIYPYNPPVNPNVFNSLVYETIPVQEPLFNETGGNELNYSGGTTELIKIPLQYNVPQNEALRTQDILITPYNRIKYSNKDPASYK